MKIHFNKIFDLKKVLLLLFICLSCGFTLLKPTVHRLSQNSFTTVESTHAIGKKKYIKNVFFFSDTLPGHHKKEKSEDWEILFNGENTDKWRGANTDKLIQNRVLANAAMSYKIIKGLVLRISGGIESNSIL